MFYMMPGDSSMLIKTSPAGLWRISLGTVYVYMPFKAAFDSNSSASHMAFPCSFFPISGVLLISQFAIVIFPSEFYNINASIAFIK